MLCPTCKCKLKVIETASAPEVVYRIKRCPQCNEDIYTIEQLCSYKDVICEIRQIRNKQAYKCHNKTNIDISPCIDTCN